MPTESQNKNKPAYRAIQADSDPRYGHVHEMSVFMVGSGVVVLLEALDELVEYFLGHFAAASLQIGESGQSKTGFQIVRQWVEGTSKRQCVRIAAELQLNGTKGVLLNTSHLVVTHRSNLK